MSSKKHRIVRAKRFAKQLASYGVGAGAALAVAGAADAAVQFRTPSSPMVINSFTDLLQLDLNSDAQYDFVFNFWSTSSYRSLWLSKGGANNGVLGSGYYGVARLIESNYVNAGMYFSGGGLLAYWSCSTGWGLFLGQRGYIGVKFDISGATNDATHYGWIDFGAAGDASWGEIYGWAWEDVADTSIHVGDTGAIPEPGHAALALLALGAAGFAYRRWRDGKTS